MSHTKFNIGDEVETIEDAPYYHSSAGSKGFITRINKRRESVDVSFYYLAGADFHRVVSYDNPKSFEVFLRDLKYVVDPLNNISPEVKHYKVLRKIQQLQKKRKDNGYAF